jgi:hypothetical protein
VCPQVRMGPDSRSKVWDPGPWIQCLLHCPVLFFIRKMFNVTPEVSDEQSLEQQGREHTFKYSMKHEDVEDTSLLSFKRICSNSLSHITPEINNRMAVIMGNKMPRNTGMALQYELRTLQESPNKTDTVPKSLKRIKVWDPGPWILCVLQNLITES